MAEHRRRTLLVGMFALDDDSVFVCDEVLPICAELDRETGRVRRILRWPLLESLRRQPAVTAVAYHDGDLWISSPAAGGMVRISRATFEHTLVPLPAIPGPMAALGDDIVVFADCEWESAPHDKLAASIVVGEHPVVWRDAPRRNSTTSCSWTAYRSADGTAVGLALGVDDDQGVGEISVDADVEDDDGAIIEASRPAWRIVDGVPVAIDLEGDGRHAVTMPNGDLIVAVRRHTDPLIKVRDSSGSIMYRYPEAVIAFHPDGSSQTLHEFDAGVLLTVDGAHLWVRYSDPDSGDPRLASINPTTGALQTMASHGRAVAIAGGIGLSIISARFTPYEVPRAGWSAQRELLSTGQVLGSTSIPAVDWDPVVAIDDGEIWMVAATQTDLVRLSVSTGDVQVIPVAVDLGGQLSAVTPAVDLDIAEFEARTVADLCAELSACWVDQHGHEKPFIDGVTFASAEIVDSFPNSTIEARFESADHPGVTFGARFALYDELGNERELEYAAIHLKERVEAAPGLPPLDRCSPDETGVVWLGSL